MKSNSLLALAFFTIATPAALAQQFQEQVGKIPGPVVWTEGVIAFDADGDGWLDVIYTNGVGFSSAGGALAPTLLMNKGPVTGFVNETAARIPAGFVQQGKGLTVCDVENDGDLDIIFANGFLTQPRILINNGAGVFTDETGTRFPAVNLNSFGVNYADIDNDGDSDLIFADAGASAFGGAGGKARLFLNDGTGHFTDAPPTQLNAVNKIGSQGIQIADLNNDFALDVVVQGKSAGQQSYINDGSGNFTLNSTLLPAATSSCYGLDLADLDNDNDNDAFIISFSGFNEGTAKNNLVETSTLSFTGSTGTLSGLNGQDDNDIAFLDANNDGILDVFVGSLANNKEKYYVNAGTFAAASFVYQAAGFTTLTDSTLDLAVGDFDNDGRYDVVTGQGESGNFLNRWYKNTGPADTIAPRIGRVEAAPATVPVETITGGGLVRRAWIQDAVVQDGRTYVKANLDITANKGGDVQNLTPAMHDSGGQIWRGVIQPTASPTGLVGMDVSYKIHAVDPPGNASDSSPVNFRICGAEGYGSTSAVNKMTIGSTPDPTAGQLMTLTTGNGPASAPALLLVGFSRISAPIVGGTLLVNPAGMIMINLATDGSGGISLPITVPSDPLIHGLVVDMQVAAADPGQAAGWSLSTGLEICFCAP